MPKHPPNSVAVYHTVQEHGREPSLCGRLDLISTDAIIGMLS
jgi:hypothetical protein